MTALPDRRVTKQALVSAAGLLGAADVAGWSGAEQRLAQREQPGRHPAGQGGDGASGPGPSLDIAMLRDLIQAGQDPLGDAFCALRDQAERRQLGQTFTPPVIIGSMTGWAARLPLRPARVVDPGCGSARFLIAAGRQWPQAQLVGVEIDPLAAVIGRASLAAAGLAARSQVVLGDYRQLRLPAVTGPTLFLGNPPYVRHHQIPGRWKDWLRRTAASQGLSASGLAGLHAHFFLATVQHAVPGDAGVLITAAEWLDVNYGRLIRELLLGALGGQSVHLVEPAIPVFVDAAATSVITCFRPGLATEALRLRRVARTDELGALAGGTPVPAGVLRAAHRWGHLLPTPGSAAPPRPATAGRQTPTGRPQPTRRPGALPAGHVELGELCRVHRGQVTGANAVWITPGEHTLIPARFQFPAVTRARELIAAGRVLPAHAELCRVIDLPADLDELAAAERAAVARFLREATAAGAADSYVARHRTPWWRVRLAEPPPILASYMGRRPPVFVRNLAGARYVNIAHGLYPREPLAPAILDALAGFLGQSVTAGQGRVYAGGLIKFEPREMERLPVPEPAGLGRVPAVSQLVRSSRDTTCATATTCTG
jgi:adenine-specific DNA-methyltransferase